MRYVRAFWRDPRIAQVREIGRSAFSYRHAPLGVIGGMMPRMSPPSFDRDWYDDWISWVLDNGLPPLPDELGNSDAVPVARWVGPRFGAVLFVEWCEDDEDGTRSLSSEIEVRCRVDGGWEAASGSGGSGWFDPPLVPPEMRADFAAVVNFHSGGGPAERDRPPWAYSSAFGFAGRAAASIEVEDDNGLAIQAIESPLGVFVVAADATKLAVLRVRRDDGTVLLEERFSPPDWWTG